MFKRFFSNKNEQNDTSLKPKLGWYQQLVQGLSKTRQQLTQGVAALTSSNSNEVNLAEIEKYLLKTDMGVKVTEQIVEWLKYQKKEDLWQGLQERLYQLLQPYELSFNPLGQAKPFLLLVVGVNGAGKTTTIGKMAHYFQKQGLTLGLAAGDTFRAAAVKQLQIWGERNHVPVIAQSSGADSASVIYDAFHAAQARNWDMVIADTAGRLPTQEHLMKELQKIGRVVKKLDECAPHEVMLVLDATIGQNAMIQVAKFQECLPLTSLALTKLDGSAKAGVIFALVEQFKLPIRFVGIGEALEDLQEFNAKNFVDALCQI